MWDVCLDAIFNCIKFFYQLCLDWGLAILIITLIFRAIITPLMYAQSKSTFMMQKVQPKIKQIQERFADDPVRMNQETQKLYAEAKFNPLASCIPMLIQMPIFIALFQVLRGMAGTKVLQEGDSLLRFYDQVVQLSGGAAISFYNIVPDLTETPASAFSQGILVALPYLILLAIFALCTFIPSLLNMNNQDATQKKTMLMMMFFMTIMMIFIGWSSPAGVLLFWGASSILAIIQQQGSLAFIKRKHAKEEAEKPVIAPVEIEVDRKPKKKRQHKKR